jgi:hypothetical protein
MSYSMLGSSALSICWMTTTEKPYIEVDLSEELISDVG